VKNSAAAAAAAATRGAMAETLGAQPDLVTDKELERLWLFDGVDLLTLRELLVDCQVRTLAPGETLLEASHVNTHIFFILTGEVEVFLPNDPLHAVARMGIGDSVGEISVIDGQPTSARVVASGNWTRCLAIDEETLWRLVSSSHAGSYNLLRSLSQRLRSNNQLIERTRQQLRANEYNANTDPLTGLYNRRWLDEHWRSFVDPAFGSVGPLSLALLDIDHFKRFNDQHGHGVGDLALRFVADLLRIHLRPRDALVRYGGEEILILLRDTALDAAQMVGERLCARVREARFHLPDGGAIPCPTISMGIAEAGLVRDSWEVLVQEADRALYQAKAEGRDRVVLAAAAPAPAQ
jgi:diguanylate cyclase (GGDEF)-like protein